MLTVYYDGICKLCSREITYYQGKVNPSKVEWIDIARNGDALKAFGITQSDALLYMHARTEDDQILVGVDAFIALWERVPYWRTLAKIISLRPVKFVAKIVYAYFAHQRFKTADHCRTQ